MDYDSLLKKYVPDECLSRAKPKARDSQFWTSLLRVGDIVYQLCKKSLGDGRNTRFWEDWWVDDKSLKLPYARLYLLSFDHNISLWLNFAKAIQEGCGGVRFRRTLYGESLNCETA